MSALNLLVFREGQRRIDGHELKQALIGQLEWLTDHGPANISPEVLMRALLLSGELECGLADAGSGAWRSASLVTDRIADALVRGEPVSDFQSLTIATRVIPVPEQLIISKAEGFAYYALHPLAYATALHKISIPVKNLIVIGIRSIGSTLSAVMAAEGRLRGMEVRRFTVRPQGHAYNRYTEFLLNQQALIQNAVFADATFAIVDEGPGLSGSSFLSVAEALKQAGVRSERIVLCSSHEPNVNALCASNAAQRWKQFRCVAASAEPQRPGAAAQFVGGGQWRSQCFGEDVASKEMQWPAAWSSLERLKYLSCAEHGQQRLFKFAGLGHYGDQVFEREKKVAEAGFGPMSKQEIDGFVSYPWLGGHGEANARPMRASDLSQPVLAWLAEYCAFRLREFPAKLADLNALQKMAEHNLRELKLDSDVALRLEHPVIADGAMQPHEWLLTKEGRMLKTDSGSHGDDHFFPGPTDIAWDLAGVIVEWRMNAEQTKEFLELYQHASGDDARERTDSFIKAYAVFRMAYCMMAANAMNGTDEQARLEQAADSYRALFINDVVQGMSAA
jgi:hypothetical protein